MARQKLVAKKSAVCYRAALRACWNRAVLAAIRDADTEALQRLQQDNAAGRPGPLTTVAHHVVTDREVMDHKRSHASLLGVAILVESEEAALWLVQNAVAEASKSQAAAAAAGLEEGDHTVAVPGDVTQVVSDSTQEGEVGGWLHSRAHFLDPFPESIQDGTGWADEELSAADGLRCRHELFTDLQEAGSATSLQLAALKAGVFKDDSPYRLSLAAPPGSSYSRSHRKVWWLLEGQLGLPALQPIQGFQDAIRGVALLERRVPGMSHDVSRVMARWLRCPCALGLRLQGQCEVCLEGGAAY